MAGEKPGQTKCQPSPSGDCHRDLAAVRTADGTLARVVALDRTWKVADAELHAEAPTMGAAQCLRTLMATVPCTMHPVLPANGLRSTNRTRDRDAWQPLCERGCQASSSDQRLTQTHQPWTNGHVARMHRALKAATVKPYHDQSHDHLQAPLQAFLLASHFATRLKTLTGLPPDDYRCSSWPKEPERVNGNPSHHTLGLNS
jgi:hypothetical protein